VDNPSGHSPFPLSFSHLGVLGGSHHSGFRVVDFGVADGGVDDTRSEVLSPQAMVSGPSILNARLPMSAGSL
jgi:hypothetical protein